MAEGKVKNKSSWGTMNLPQNKKLPVVGYTLKINKELYAELCALADRRGGENLSDVMLELLANGVGRPELGFMPRKKMGRPRKVHRVRKPRAEPQPA